MQSPKLCRKKPLTPQMHQNPIVSLGKKAGSVVDKLYRGATPVFCVPRTIGDTYVSDEALAVHENMRQRLIGSSDPH